VNAPRQNEYRPTAVSDAQAAARIESFEKNPEKGGMPASDRLPIHIST
jgi:hypothetical protein